MHSRKRSRQRAKVRRFLVKTLPDGLRFSSLPATELVQSCLILTEDGESLSLRQGSDSCRLTLRGADGKRGPEVGISKMQYDALAGSRSKAKLFKTSYTAPLGKGNTARLEFYNGPLEGRVIAEVGFSTEGDAKRFHLPYWFGRDVTKDGDYGDSRLALRQGPMGDWAAALPRQPETEPKAASRRVSSLLLELLRDPKRIGQFPFETARHVAGLELGRAGGAAGAATGQAQRKYLAYSTGDKGREAITAEDLAKAGAHRVAAGKQVDAYYAPDDGSSAESGERLRIRIEGDRKVLTYSGPAAAAQPAEGRQLLSFELGKDVETLFAGLYKMQPQSTVIKESRTLYWFNGVLVNHDTGITIGVVENAGYPPSVRHPMNYLEFSLDGGEAALGAMERLARALGLDESRSTPKSYIEMGS